MLIQLLKYLKDEHPFGNEEGREVFRRIHDVLASHPQCKIFGISLNGILATDASFPRESIVSLAKMYKGEKGFYLSDFSSDDMIDNWHYAANAKGQPLIIKLKKGYRVIGPELTESATELLDFIMLKNIVTTSVVAAHFDISVQNASAKLKKLYETGLILGSKETAETGGLEYVYTAIK